MTKSRILFQNQWITVESQSWDSLDHEYTVVQPRLGKAVAIIPVRFIKNEPEVLMLSQPRIPSGKLLWEFPAGGVDENEDVLTAAIRELEEETNIHVKDFELVSLGNHYLFPTLINETLHIYGVVLPKHYPFNSIKPAIGEIEQLKWMSKNDAYIKCASDDSYDFSSLGKMVLAEQAGLFNPEISDS